MRSATTDPSSVRLLPSAALREQHHREGLAGARGQHVVAHVADAW